MAVGKETRLQRSLGVLDLTLIGIGASVGSGIFVFTGVVAKAAGPGVVLSYLIAAGICVFDALCYAELASRFPFSGGAYLFVRRSFGLLPALIVSANLLFDYHIGAAVIARSFAAYLANCVTQLGASSSAADWVEAIPLAGVLSLNVVAPALLALLTLVLYRGAKEGTTLNMILTGSKMLTILVVIVAGSLKVDSANWEPFFPKGLMPVFAESSTLFFAYVGFDAVANSVEECRDPTRDVPWAIVASLVICAGLYVGVVLVLTGLVQISDIDVSAPLAVAFQGISGFGWVQIVVDIGGIVGLATTLLVGLYAQARVYLGLARDGVLPERLAAVHPTFASPGAAQVWCGFVAMVLATFLNVSVLTSLLSIGTMLSYTLVCAAVLVLRSNNPPIALRGLITSACLSLGLGLTLRLGAPMVATLALAGLLSLSILPFFKSMQFTTPDSYACPAVPFVPWFGFCANIATACQLSAAAWIRLAVVTILVTGVVKLKARARGGSAPALDPEPKVPALEPRVSSDLERPASMANMAQLGERSVDGGPGTSLTAAVS